MIGHIYIQTIRDYYFIYIYILLFTVAGRILFHIYANKATDLYRVSSIISRPIYVYCIY